MKSNSTKEIATGAPNDTLHQNNAHPKNSPIDCWWGAADPCTMSHGTYIQIKM